MYSRKIFRIPEMKNIGFRRTPPETFFAGRRDDFWVNTSKCEPHRHCSFTFTARLGHLEQHGRAAIRSRGMECERLQGLKALYLTTFRLRAAYSPTGRANKHFTL